MNEATHTNLEAWVRYYQDLGLDLGYRDRATSAPAPGDPAPTSPPAPIPSGIRRNVPPPARVSPLAILQAPSLFDAIERVEGDTLERIRADIGDCTRCRLHKQRTNIVYGVGSPTAELVFVGEGPGHEEDLQGIPFVGRAGRLLTQMIEAMGLRRDDVYICNVVKCRPPENRNPEKDEIATCSPFLLRQIAAIHPKVIVCLGNVAAQALLGTNRSISHFRGQWFDFRGSRLIATYHPAYLLRNPNAKGEVWNDLKKVIALLGLKPPRKAPH
jgi:uracil-DNA glycosylase family 4